MPGEHEAVEVTAAGLHPIVKALAGGGHYGSTDRLPMVPARAAAAGEFRIGVEPVPLADVQDAWERDQHGHRFVLIP